MFAHDPLSWHVQKNIAMSHYCAKEFSFKFKCDVKGVNEMSHCTHTLSFILGHMKTVSVVFSAMTETIPTWLEYIDRKHHITNRL